MKYFSFGSISKNLAFLVIIAVLPALAILLYTGIEQRHDSIQHAKQNVLLLTHSMTRVQQDITRSCQQTLSTLARLPALQSLDLEATQKILATVLEDNPGFYNMALTALDGTVLTAGKDFSAVNLADRKHIKHALATKTFAAGEFIMTRIGNQAQVFPFAYPVLDKNRQSVAVLTTAVKLDYFIPFYEAAKLPEKSFVAVTDHQGIRLLYYPETHTNPIGEPINPDVWKIASNSKEPGLFIRAGSDGHRRILAFEQLRLSPDDEPYMYLWAGIPEAPTLETANATLTRNLLLMLLATGLALLIAWRLGRSRLLVPINQLVAMTHKFAEGDLAVHSGLAAQTDEFDTLTRAFHDMAEALDAGQKALAEESERLAVTLRSIGDGVITTDTEGRIILINQAAESLIALDRQEAVGKPLDEFFSLIDEKTGQSLESLVKKVLEKAESFSPAGQPILIDRRGQKKNISATGAPIRDRAGKTIGVVLVFRDITDQLRTEQELIKIKKLESVGVLAGGIAHDFNNILAAILGNIDLSLRDGTLSETTQRRLKQAQTASIRARDLTQQLLTFAKGGQPIKETAALVEVVKESAEFVLRGDKVACRYQLPDDLWLVDIDKGQISQVIQNIIINASNAMPQGGMINIAAANIHAAELQSSALSTATDYVRLDIKDSGIGIPANVLDRIFDPYFTTKQQGSGLGLAISHSIISKHGGAITVGSTPGVGSTFSIYLPTSLESSAPQKQPAALDLISRKARILVMDDEQIVRDIAREMLEEMGHEVLCADDGAAAVQKYQEAVDSNAPIDLLIMDLTIPGGVGGQEAVKQILAINSKARAIVSSGYSNDPVLANYADYGFCAAIVKPYQLTDLSSLLHRLLG